MKPGWIQITRFKNGVSICEVPHGINTSPAQDATVIQFQPIDGYHRQPVWNDPVGHILKVLEPMLRRMDAVYVEENTPPAPPSDPNDQEGKA